MSKYTTQLRYVCDEFGRDNVENWFKDYNLEDYLLPAQIKIIEEAGLWNKDKLASMIVDAYYMREIGLETPFLFKHYAKIEMRAIMETALPLIYTNSIEYNPLINIDYTEEFNRTIKRTGTTEGTSQIQGDGLTINSDTPQGNINKTQILAGNYATSTSAGESSTSSSDTSSSNGEDIEGSTKHIKGNSGISATNQKLIEQYRNNIISINSMIIERLNTLFMAIY